MNHESLISLMDGVSDDLIVEAAAPQRKTLTLRRGIAFAAAVAAVLALVLGIPFLNRDNEIVTLPGVITVNAITDPSKSEVFRWRKQTANSLSSLFLYTHSQTGPVALQFIILFRIHLIILKFNSLFPMVFFSRCICIVRKVIQSKKT